MPHLSMMLSMCRRFLTCSLTTATIWEEMRYVTFIAAFRAITVFKKHIPAVWFSLSTFFSAGFVQWFHWSQNYIADLYWAYLLPAIKAHGRWQNSLPCKRANSDPQQTTNGRSISVRNRCIRADFPMQVFVNNSCIIKHKIRCKMEGGWFGSFRIRYCISEQVRFHRWPFKSAKGFIRSEPGLLSGCPHQWWIMRTYSHVEFMLLFSFPQWWWPSFWRNGTRLSDCSRSSTVLKGTIVWSFRPISGSCVQFVWVNGNSKYPDTHLRVQGLS